MDPDQVTMDVLDDFDSDYVDTTGKLDPDETIDFDATDDLLKVKYYRSFSDAIAPTSVTDAQHLYHLYTPKSIFLVSNEVVKIDTGIKLAFKHSYGRIINDVSIFEKHNIGVVGSGVIDTNYQGNLIVPIKNLSSDSVCLKKGAKIAILLLKQRTYAEALEFGGGDLAPKKKLPPPPPPPPGFVKQKKRRQKFRHDSSSEEENEQEEGEIDKTNDTSSTCPQAQSPHANPESTPTTQNQRSHRPKKSSIGTQTRREKAKIKFCKVGRNPASLIKRDDGDVCYDICLPNMGSTDLMLAPRTMKKISLGLRFLLPPNWHGQVLERSSIAANYGIRLVGNGRIPSSFKKGIALSIFNDGNNHFCLKTGCRIAQIVFEKNPSFTLEETSRFAPEFRDPTVRGDHGFGSTGM